MPQVLGMRYYNIPLVVRHAPGGTTACYYNIPLVAIQAALKCEHLSYLFQTVFMQFDRDRSGTVEPHELQQAITTFGYRLSPQAMGVIIRRYSTASRVAFDQFVALCVKLRLATSKL